MTSFRKRMEKASTKSRIILANDLDDSGADKLERKTLSNITLLGGNLCAIKLNFHVILPLSEESLSRINRHAHRKGLQTIADIKLNDIGSTNMQAVKRLWRCGFDAVIANPIMGPENLKALVGEAHDQNRGVIALVHMSHPGAKLGYGLSIRNPKTGKPQKLHDLFLKWSNSANVDGVVVGATVPDVIIQTKKIIGNRCDIYSPGVGTQGGSAKEALEAGSRYLIVGRTILNSKHPVLDAKKLQHLSIES
ncbi:MAG TPA: orotidine 5'-phosphate decarboxylase [Candidatus Nitrosotalea sp.]|nr:orotidine 5'-phosphate decarboxylase [Candidatus Nitrosotalea sp.]